MVERAVAEDLPAGDPTGALVGGRPALAHLVTREPGTLSGLVAVPLVLDQVAVTLGSGAGRAEIVAADGTAVPAGAVVATLQGPADTLLAAERTVLNIVTHLSGVASLTAAAVRAVAGTGTTVRDTRKTLPGLRAVEKYAVRCGGGANHRMDLSDAILVKDNHIAALGGVVPAVQQARRAAGARGVTVEVEVDTLEQLDDALAAGADLVLLDNMGVEELAEAVRRARAHKARTEASGGLRLQGLAEVAATGVDFVAIGALTHSAPALDVGMDWNVGA